MLRSCANEAGERRQGPNRKGGGVKMMKTMTIMPVACVGLGPEKASLEEQLFHIFLL